MTENTQSESDAQDPSQLIPPRVDTAPEILAGATPRDLLAVAPGAAALGVGGVAAVTGHPLLATVGLGAGVVLGAAGIAARLTTSWYNTPRERIAAWVAYLRRDDDPTALDTSVTGVSGVTSEGFLEMDDGRYVGVVAVEPRNTAHLDPEERHTLAASLSSAVDEQIRDISFRFHSTTRPASVDDVADRYADAAVAEDGPREFVLSDRATWLTDVDAPAWDAREWRHYVVVEAAPSDARASDPPSFLELVNPLTDTEDVPDERVTDTLADRVDAVCAAVASVSGLDATPVDPATALDVAGSYWGRSTATPDRVVDDAIAGDVDAARLVAPAEWAPERGWVSLGDEYARAMWLAEYPTEPASLWLRRLTTLDGVSVDVTVNAEPEQQDAAAHEVAKDVADVGAEGAERAAEQDVSARDTEQANAANVRMRDLFRDTPTQPWQMSAYVVVRARDRDAVDAAAGAASETFDGARLAALRDATETVESVLTRSPANTTPVTPGVAQPLAFRAAAPTTAPVWDRETSGDKTRRVPGGVLGAMFPFVGAELREPTGVDWGRNLDTGRLLRASPFERGGAPHLLTIGQSRSGKTYAASTAALRWYLEGDDRTLLVCDTQQGFDGLTEVCDGEHIVVDGTQSVNPLKIEPSDSDGGASADEFRLTVEETVGFIVGLLRADDVATPGEYAPLLSQAAERTLADAGITPDDPASFARESPTLDDLLATLVDMNDNPGRYTFSDAGHEVDSHEEQVGELLTMLRSFQDGGKYATLVGDDDLGLESDDVTMAYLDLHALAGSDDAETSAMLQVMLSHVREKIKTSSGEVLFLVDEAHVLLDGERTVDWLQKATREFARYDAALWFLSQSPSDFVAGPGESAARDTIRAQCSTVQFFRTPRVDDATLKQFGLNASQREFVRNDAVRGKTGRGFSECLLDFEDVEGWLPCHVEAAPGEHRVATYDRDADGDLGDHVRGESA